MGIAQDFPFPFYIMFVHGGVICALFMLLNGYMWWRRGKPIREKYPERTDGYKKILTWFVGVTAGFFLLIEFAVLTGIWENIFSFLDTDTHGLFELVLMIYMFGAGLLLNYWVFFKGGADYLAKHPGYFYSHNEKWNKFWFRFHALSVPFTHIIFLAGLYFGWVHPA